MPKAKTPKVKAPKTKGTRTRSGCITCRQRKVKCDEVFVDSSCANCRRINKKCDTDIVITFRNEHNPSFSRPKDTFENFYTYRNTFKPGGTWVPVPADLRFVEVDASKILDPDDEDTTPKRKGAKSSSNYPQLLPPAQQSQDQMTEGLQALSDAAIANEERTLYSQDLDPQDFTLWDDTIWWEDDPDDEDYVPPQDLLPLSQYQQQQLEQLQEQDRMDMQSEAENAQAQAQEYANESMDLFLREAAAHTAGHIDPDLERLTNGASGSMSSQWPE